MNKLRPHANQALLHLLAVAAVGLILSKSPWGGVVLFPADPGLASGKWALRFLLASLAMSPLRTYLGWNPAIKLRKPAGLWSFGFAALHVGFYVRAAGVSWLRKPLPAFLALGLLGFLILLALALTSNRRAMRRLGKSWKRLHRFVYLAGGAVVVHALLATLYSKKMLVSDPEAVYELRLHLVLLSSVLALRLPLVRRLLQRVPSKPPARSQAVLEAQSSPALPSRPGLDRDRDHESALKDTLEIHWLEAAAETTAEPKEVRPR